MQISPQKQHLQQKWSIPQRSQYKMLGDGNRKNVWRFILRGVNSPTKWEIWGIICIFKQEAVQGYTGFF